MKNWSVGRMKWWSEGSKFQYSSTPPLQSRGGLHEVEW